MLSWLTAPGAGREYSLTRLRSAANTSLDPPTLVLPNVSDSPRARGASAAEALRHTAAMKTPSGALGRARRAEGSAHLEEPAVVVDPMDLLLDGVDPRGSVGDHRVVLPAVPELAADLDELLGNRAPLVRVWRVFFTEILGFSVGRRTRRVPGCAPTAPALPLG